MQEHRNQQTFLSHLAIAKLYGGEHGWIARIVTEKEYKGAPYDWKRPFK